MYVYIMIYTVLIQMIGILILILPAAPFCESVPCSGRLDTIALKRKLNSLCQTKRKQTNPERHAHTCVHRMIRMGFVSMLHNSCNYSVIFVLPQYHSQVSFWFYIKMSLYWYQTCQTSAIRFICDCPSECLFEKFSCVDLQ